MRNLINQKNETSMFKHPVVFTVNLCRFMKIYVNLTVAAKGSHPTEFDPTSLSPSVTAQLA